jgi:hypothetical protein
VAEDLDMRFESLLRSTLKAEAASVPVSIGLDDVLRRREQRRRRFGWLTDPRPRPRDRGLRLATVLGVLALAAVVGFAALLGGMPAVIPGGSPSPSPSPSPRSIPDTGGHMHLELEPDAWYADHGFPFRVELTLPALASGRWEGQVVRPPLTDQPAISIHRGLPLDGSGGMTVSSAELDIAVVEEVYLDPCAAEMSARQAIRSANELLDWLEGIAGDAAPPTAVAVGDLRGWQLVGLVGACRQTGGPDARTYSLLADGLWLAPHAPSTVTVLEVSGSVVALRATVDPSQEALEQRAITEVMSSIRFGTSVESGPAPTPVNPWPGRTLGPGVAPRHSPEDVEAKVMAVIAEGERAFGRLAEPSIRVTLLPPGNVYLNHRTDGLPAGGIGPSDELAWVAEFEGTFAHTFFQSGQEPRACTAGVILYLDEGLAERARGCRDVDPLELTSPSPL